MISSDTFIVSPTITGTGDLDHVEHYYYDGQRMIEARNGSGQVIRGWV